MSKVTLLVGTKKGAFLFTANGTRAQWDVEGPFFKGMPINHLAYDRRDGSMLAAVNDVFYGAQVHRSADGGKTWQAAQEQPRFDPEAGLSVEKFWCLEPGLESQPGVIYVGVEPAALFRSEDGGDTWAEVTGINRHPTRDQWFPGGGGLCLHTIALDPSDPLRMYVAISAAGTFRTDDGGATWKPVNKGVRADFIPVPDPELGHCVHKLVLHPDQPETLFQQNHCGVFRSDDRGDTWRPIEEGLPSRFGFPMAVHPRHPQTVYIAPQEADMARLAPGGAFAIYRSTDGGECWQPLRQGLPQEGAYLGVLREGLAVDALDPCGVYVGTSTGQLFASADEGESWSVVASWLPPILSVSCGTTV